MFKTLTDGGYQGECAVGYLRKTSTWSLEIVKRSDTAKGFAVLPKRWIVERTLAWISRRRLTHKNLARTTSP